MPETVTQTTQVGKKGMSTGVKIAIGCGGLLLLLVVCFFVASMAGFAGLSKISEEVEKTTQESEEQKDTAFENPASMNEAVVIDDVEWTLLSGSDLGSTIPSVSEYSDDCVANSGKFIKLTLTVKNNSKKMVSVSNLDLFDSEQNQYITSSDVYNCSEDDIFILDNINPGIEKTFTGIYEVPSTASGFRVKVGDLDFFTDNYKYISLGF
ncbi:DUF4352 domain-containing protein [Candidatus Dojkabacteria bacterium]|uniref:DUF4352 domain-containing protein n=1 Tax=Candidatus Dojkabacteria bacterium TaxID=2099670 RepID=A0A955L031_9BACT|nr:DUF4352 domain-containing protein [Candidatus Dojkabacteria bacterium]